MRKSLWLLTAAVLLPCMVAAATPKVTAPPDSEMVYRANLGRAEDMELLLRQGGNIKAVDNNGVGLLFLAAGRTDEEGVNVVHSLLSHGIPISSVDSYGRTALFFAAKAGNALTVQYLLNNGIDAYSTDNNGDVARNYAYRNGHTDVVEMMDDFARKKIEEVNSAYERINQELQKRYQELSMTPQKEPETNLYPPLVATENAPPAPPAPVVPRASDAPVVTQETPALEEETTEATEPAAQQDEEEDDSPEAQAAREMVARVDATLDELHNRKTLEARIREEGDNSPEADAARKIVARIDAKMNELRDQKMLEARINEEERLMTESERDLQAKIAEERMQQQLSDEKEQVVAAKKAEREAERKAADELRQSLENANMAVDLKAEIEAEAAEMKRQQMQEDARNPELRAAKVAQEKELQKKRDDAFGKLAYHNCMFQYWYYCYTSGMTTELQPEALRDTIETNKDKIAELQELLQKEYGVTHPEIQKVAFTGKMRVFSQLNLMKSSRQRRSEGVGNVDDAEKRCGDIGLHWDIGPGSVTDERVVPDEDSKDGAAPASKAGGKRRPGAAPSRAPSGGKGKGGGGKASSSGMNNSMVMTTQPPAGYAPYPTASSQGGKGGAKQRGGGGQQRKQRNNRR